MSRILQVFYVIFSGALVALSLPSDFLRFGSPILALFSLVSFYIAIRKIDSTPGFVISFAILTFTTHMISSYWLAFFKDFAIFTLGASALGTSAIGGGFGLLYSIPFSKCKKWKVLVQNNGSSAGTFLCFRILWFCAIYVCYEWFKSIGFLGYPWGTISMAFFQWNNFIQIADITGTYGVTFLCVLFSAVVAEAIMLLQNKWEEGASSSFFGLRNCFVLLAVLFCADLVYGVYRTHSLKSPVKQINTIMVQQNSDPWKNISDEDTILVSQKLTDQAFETAKENGERVDLVVWSEGCLKSQLPLFINHYEYTPGAEPLLKFIRKHKVPFLVGSPFRREGSSARTMNGACIIDENGQFRGAYPKNHLVPFAEALPFSELPEVNKFLMKSIGISAGWAPGDQYTFFKIKASYPKNYVQTCWTYDLTNSMENDKKHLEFSDVLISTPICYDDAFPDICRPLVQNGSEVFMNITDDSWSKKASSEYQHFVVSAYRAIEYRTTLARSTNSGYSAVVDPNGRIIKDMPLFQESSIFVKIPVYERQKTIYLEFGNWLPKIMALLCLSFAIYLMFSKKEKSIFEDSQRKKLRKIQKKYRESF